MTAIGLWGNAFILGGQIKEVKDEIKEVKHEVKDVKDELGGQIKEVKHYIKGLIARQTEMELHDMSVAAKLFKDCGKN